MPASSDTPQLQMVEHFRARAKETPAPTAYKKSFSLVAPREHVAIVHHKARERGQSLKDSRAGPHSHIMPKRSEPGPGHYKAQDAVVKT